MVAKPVTATVQAISTRQSLHRLHRSVAVSGDATMQLGVLTTMCPLSTQQYLIAQRVAHSLNESPAAMDHVVAAICCTAGYSLRMLDWLVTNMSKRLRLRLCTARGDSVYVHEDYRSALSNFRRRNFDPFRRSQRAACGALAEFVVVLRHPGGDVRSTLGQVNFLEWAWRVGVLDYAAAHAHRIERDMQAASRRKRDDDVRRRGEALTDGPISMCHAYAYSRSVAIA